MNNNAELIEKIKRIYKSREYPVVDYFEAVAHMDFKEPDALRERKIFCDLTLPDFRRNYSFLFFLDEASASYYVSAYMIAILEHEELVCHFCMDTLLMVLSKIDCRHLSRDEVLIIIEFLNLFISNDDVIEDQLYDAISNMKKCLSGFEKN